MEKYNIGDLEELSGFNFLLNIKETKVKPTGWANQHKSDIENILNSNGAVLIRGLQFHGSKQFSQFLSSIFDSTLLDYEYRSTPRTKFKENIYTATEYPSSEVIAQHNENAYQRTPPKRIGFVCLQPSETGGETPIGDCRTIYRKLPEFIRNKFEDKGVLYLRNYSDIDLPWTEVFQTNDKQVVERYCLENDIEFEWLENEKLRTKQINPAVIIDSKTKEKIWLNQAHLFHYSNLDKDLYTTLIDSLGEENLPRD
jgi:hypothetical protein